MSEANHKSILILFIIQFWLNVLPCGGHKALMNYAFMIMNRNTCAFLPVKYFNSKNNFNHLSHFLPKNCFYQAS